VKAVRWLLPLAALPVLGLLAYGLTRNTYVLPSPLIERPAPDFRLTTLGGDSLALADLRGEVVVLNFWASWCLPCREEHPVLERLAADYAGSGVRLIGIVYEDTPENARRFLRRYGGGWPSLIDPESRVAIDYGVYGPPETFFLGRSGTIARKQIGPVNWELVRSVTDSLLAAPATGDDSAAADGDSEEAGGESVVEVGT